MVTINGLLVNEKYNDVCEQFIREYPSYYLRNGIEAKFTYEIGNQTIVVRVLKIK